MALRDTIIRLALENAIRFKGKANPKALVGGVVREHPEAKENMSQVQSLIQEIIEQINALSFEEQQQKLNELNPNFASNELEKKQARKAKANELPELPNAKHGEVVTRMPPEPSKYNHLGHAMSFLINYLYAKKYQGHCILRFDDTNPEKATQEYVDAVHEDVISYLRITPDAIKYASGNMHKYYSYAERLISEGHAYVCSCAQESMRSMRREGKECEHRTQSIEENQSLWERMKKGDVNEGSVVLRLKIDMQHKNAVMRDPVIYRLCYTHHYRTGDQFKVWPMYDFESTVEEGLCGITHVLRSNEFDQRIELQKYIANLLDFPEVTFKHYGRYNVTGATTQGREIRSLIETGNYIGWDDPRLVTLRALRRRGIVSEAYYRLAQQIGLSKTQTNLDFSVIASVNRGLLDKTAKRFFCIRNPVEIIVHKIPFEVSLFELKLHPENEIEGVRCLAASHEYYIEKEDHNAIPVGGTVRFMDAMNLKKVSETEYEFIDLEYASFLENSHHGPLIHFVPKDGNEIKGEIFMPDTSLQYVICEPSIASLSPDEVIQFERYAFCRLDELADDGTYKFWYTHD